MVSKGDESSPASYEVIAYKALNIPSGFENVVKAPFLNSLRYGNDLFKLIDQESYYTAYGKYIDSLLKRPKAIVRFAVLDDLTVLGWSLTEVDIVHYVWVKKEVRRQGIAKALVPFEFKFFSHITNKGLSIWNAKCPQARFNPFA